MKNGAGRRRFWSRAAPASKRSSARPSLDSGLVSVERTFGGLANTNFRLELSDSRLEPSGKTVLLRYWQRDQQQAAKEIALLSFVGRRVPVPAVLASGDADPDFGLPFAFMQWIDGERLDALAPRLAPAALKDVGRERRRRARRDPWLRL